MFKLHGKTYRTLKGAKIAARAWLKNQPDGRYGLTTWADIAEYKNGAPAVWHRVFK